MVGGKYTGLMAMALALSATGGGMFDGPQIRGCDMPKNVPDDRGRRREKDDAAIAKAEAKRRRKAEKRVAHNAQVQASGAGLCAASPGTES